MFKLKFYVMYLKKFMLNQKLDACKTMDLEKKWVCKRNMDFLFSKNNSDDDESNLLKIYTCRLKPKQCNIGNFIF